MDGSWEAGVTCGGGGRRHDLGVLVTQPATSILMSASVENKMMVTIDKLERHAPRREGGRPSDCLKPIHGMYPSTMPTQNAMLAWPRKGDPGQLQPGGAGGQCAIRGALP